MYNTHFQTSLSLLFHTHAQRHFRCMTQHYKHYETKDFLDICAQVITVIGNRVWPLGYTCIIPVVANVPLSKVSNTKCHQSVGNCLLTFICMYRRNWSLRERKCVIYTLITDNTKTFVTCKRVHFKWLEIYNFIDLTELCSQKTWQCCCLQDRCVNKKLKILWD